jgi:AAA+ superfamily predicted ATPase
MNPAENRTFESRSELPSPDLETRATRLIGFDQRFARLSGQIRLLTDTEGVKNWAEKHHQGGKAIVAALRDRYPLVVFHGDVGTGKTATAESAADAIARMLDVEGFLLKLSTRVRGIGHVGEMSTLIGDAFAEATELAGKKRFVAVIIDEGDALAFNRAAERAHHEDRVGVNTLIQKIDDARRLNGRLLIILCTNRYSALDPAILRRASLVEEFLRPNTEERQQLLTADLEGVKIAPELLQELIAVTGAHDGKPGFTFSDIQTRLLPMAVARAYPENRPLTGEDLLTAASELGPTPAIDEVSD